MSKLQSQKPTPVLDVFFKMAGAAAQRGGIKVLVMVAQDPQTGEMKLVSTSDAMSAVKDVVAAKFGLSDPDIDIGWPGV
jgi:hypothetical protein